MESLRFLAAASFLAGGPAGASHAVAQQAVSTRVDPRVELVTAVARLAGFEEFDMANSRSPYAEAVERHFGPLREHRAVKLLAELRSRDSISYDAVPAFAVHLDGIERLGEITPFEPQPERLDSRWTPASAREFAAALRDFAERSKAAEFFAGQRESFAEVERRLAERLSQSKALPWFDSFFGAKPGARYTAVAGLLCGGGCFGVGVRFADGRPEQITPVFGCWEWDEGGLPVFGEAYLPLFIHELCHSYSNPLVHRFSKELEPHLVRVLASCAEPMRQQAYGTWKAVAYESLVRACVVRCRLATEGRAAAEEQAREEVGNHFAWVPELAALLGRYEGDRGKYPTLVAFMPEVVEFFEGYAAKLDELDAKRPKLVSIEPANGAVEVDPSLERLTLVFDRAMTDQSWSITGNRQDQPEITGRLAYDESRKTLTIPVRLESGRTYRFALNGLGKVGFKSAEGVPLAPVEVTFSTRR